MKKLLLVCMFVFFCLTAAEAQQKKNLITVNLQDVELTNVVKFISDVTGKNFIFDDSLKGKVTIVAPAKISADEAFNLFTSVLNLKGYTMIPAPGNLLKIVPAAQAKSLSSEVDKDRGNDTYITKLIPLAYVSSDNAMKFLQPLISKDGHISVFGTGNYLLIVDSSLNIRRLEHILSYIDKPIVKEEPEMHYLKHTAADDLAKLLTDSLGKKERGISTDDIRILAEPRLNALILIGPAYAKESVKKLIEVLDVPQKEVKGNINVYFLENADATELAKVLDAVLKAADEKSKQPQEAKPKVSITPDKATNSLIISASSGVYQNMLGIIKDLDKRRRQVFVEAMIVEASIDRLKELGSKWRTLATNRGEPVAITGFGTMDSSTMLSVVNGLSGFSVGGMGNFFTVPITQGTTTANLTVPGFSALFSLNEFKDAVNVLSTPQILTSDNKEAEIVVGENVPFVSRRETDPARTQSLFNVVERKDVGITLKLTPQITEGEYVKLDLYQEISSLKQETNVDILTQIGPTTTKRSTKTSVVVKDKQTVVISGLMQERGEEIITKVPFLGDIPLLGFLFRFKSYNTKKTNLLVFLTPHIIRDAAELTQLANAKRSEFATQMAEERFAEALVRLKEGVSEETLQKLLKRHEMKIRNKNKDGSYNIIIPDDKGFQEVKEIFTKAGIADHIEPSLKVRQQ